MSTTYYTSRSAIETRQDCPRKRYLNYHYNNKGIVLANKNIPLTTGICTHKGTEFMMSAYHSNNSDEGKLDKNWKREELIQAAVDQATISYLTLLENSKFSGTLEKEQEFVKQEQLALTEALVRAWGMREFPMIIKYYRVLEVEKEFSESWLLEPIRNIIFQGKADAILETKDSAKDILVYSLKTIKDFNWQVEKSYKRDLQGITETYLTNQFLQERNKELEFSIGNLSIMRNIDMSKVIDYISKLKTNSHSSGVKFCYLVKGTRKESDFEPGHYLTYNPLIRGYKKTTLSGIEWAHSWFIINPENKSGKGTLGKGWEPFNVWESEHWGASKGESIKNWIEAIDRGEIQKDLVDPIKGVVRTPIEIRRDKREIEEDIEILKREEISFFETLSQGDDGNKWDSQSIVFKLEKGLKTFGKTRKRCDYPTSCDYKKICFGENEDGSICENSELVQIDPIGSREYQIREPHHKLEMEGLK